MLNENIVRTLIDQDVINLRYLLEVKKFAGKYNKIAAEYLRSHSKEAVEWILSETAEIHNSTYHHVYIQGPGSRVRGTGTLTHTSYNY